MRLGTETVPALLVQVVSFITEGAHTVFVGRVTLIVGAFKVLLIQLVCGNHLDAVFKSDISPGIVIYALLH